MGCGEGQVFGEGWQGRAGSFPSSPCQTCLDLTSREMLTINEYPKTVSGSFGTCFSLTVQNLLFNAIVCCFFFWLFFSPFFPPSLLSYLLSYKSLMIFVFKDKLFHHEAVVLSAILTSPVLWISECCILFCSAFSAQWYILTRSLESVFPQENLGLALASKLQSNLSA